MRRRDDHRDIHLTSEVQFRLGVALLVISAAVSVATITGLCIYSAGLPL